MTRADSYRAAAAVITTIIILLIPLSIHAQSVGITLNVRVVDETTMKPIPGEIYSRKNCPGKDCKFIGLFDAAKSYLPVPCEAGFKLYAVPTVGGYHKLTRDGNCYAKDAKVDLLATPTSHTRFAVMAGATAFELGEYGDAVVLYSQAITVRPSKDIERALYLAIAKELSVSEQQAVYFDPLQNKNVATAVLVEKIKEFQAKNKIAADGIIGLHTQMAIAGNKTPLEVALKYTSASVREP